jgi:predicted secreted protein
MRIELAWRLAIARNRPVGWRKVKREGNAALGGEESAKTQATAERFLISACAVVLELPALAGGGDV